MEQEVRLRVRSKSPFSCTLPLLYCSLVLFQFREEGEVEQ